MSKKNVVLCGFMGAGKSTIGKVLAEKLSRPFFDSDSLLQAKLNATVSDIFKMFGESHFRKTEQIIIAELCKYNSSVISIGGGALCSPQNAKILKSAGEIVFLNAGIDVIKQRLKDDESRPLLVGISQDDLKKLYQDRKKLYLLYSDVDVNADLKIDDVCNQILSYLSKSECS